MNCLKYSQEITNDLMTEVNPTDRIITQGRVLVQAIDALDTIEPRDPFERAVAELLQAAYERCLWAIVAEVPSWVSEEILRSSERIGGQASSVVGEQELGMAAVAL